MSAFAEFLWPLVAAYAVWRLAPALERFAPDRSAPTGTGEIPIPDDLLGLAMQYDDRWAQEDTIKVIRERFAALGDWEKVRVAMGVARVSP